MSALHTITSPLSERMDIIRSHQGDHREVDPSAAANDVDLLHQMGYKEELKRTFSTWQIFFIAYSIMGLLPSIASTTALGLSSGPAGFLWSWLLSSFFIVLVGISMSELGSAMPTSGGLFYWTWYYAPDKIKIPLSYLIGLSNTMALCGGLCSINYGFALEVVSAAVINTDGEFVSTNGKIYGIFAAGVVSHVAATCLSSKNVAWLQTISATCNSGLIVLWLIAIPIGTAKNGSFNDGAFIFGQLDNLATWDQGWQFMLSMMTAIWTIGAFDSCVHMSEEAKNASYGVPIGIVGSCSVCGIVGFFIIICTNACMNPNLEELMSTETGFIMAQIAYDSLGKQWAVAIMVLMACCQWLMGASILAALSRQIWAFARDDGLPFATYVKVVHKTLKVPLRAVYFAGVIALLIGLLTLAGSAASNALFSLGVAGNYLAWCLPVFLRLTSGKHVFKPGKFHLGWLSKPLNWVTCIWGLFVIILAMFPNYSTVDKEDMNYTVVITCGVWILSLVYYYTYKYKVYFGPKSNLEDPTDAIDEVNVSPVKNESEAESKEEV